MDPKLLKKGADRIRGSTKIEDPYSRLGAKKIRIRIYDLTKDTDPFCRHFRRRASITLDLGLGIKETSHIKNKYFVTSSLRQYKAVVIMRKTIIVLGA